MKKLMIIALLLPVLFCGCATVAKWDTQAYTENKNFAISTMRTWSFNSGFYSCGLLAQKLTFPMTIKNAADLQFVFQNPTVILGISQLDEIAKTSNDPKTGKIYWSEDDYNLGCSLGIKSRVTISEVMAVIKAFYPAASAYLPSFQ